jgi:cytochrome c-type biogenesis protein CcmF
MIPELGCFALILALLLAISLACFPLLGAQQAKPAWMRMARPLTLGHGLFILISYGCLSYAFITNDFSVQYVAMNSNSSLPLIYRICAVWGAHEGSLLLWVTILSLWMIAIALGSRHLPQDIMARVLAVLGMISTGFLLFLLVTSSPFKRLLPDFPTDGQDLNPLLQDPGLIIHPPMLYMGYVGFSVAFAFALAALWAGRFDASWARWTRPWTLTAWCFLTFGITLGSWWAYRELGWGGWWFWDPVENASLLPWLAGTALIHSLIVADRRNLFKGWTLLLAICAFSLSLLGTFLVRSGVLVSVHAFASDPSRGTFILAFLLLVIGGSLLLYAWRAPKLHSLPGKFALLSRETLLLGNNLILLVAMATVLLGTVYPLLIDAMGLGKISVGPPYFNTVMVPLFIPLLLLVGIGPLCHWHNTQAKQLCQRLLPLFLLSGLCGVLLPLVFTGKLAFSVCLGLTLAGWIICTTLTYLLDQSIRAAGWRLAARHYGMVCAHLGLAICLLGITLTSHYSVERDVQMAPGETVEVGSYQFSFLGLKQRSGPNYRATIGEFKVTKGQRTIALLEPEKRIYQAQGAVMTDAAIDAGLWRDLYVALGTPVGEQSWGVRLYYKPFVRWIWLGGIFMLLGGLLGLWDKLRVKSCAR